jgi:hypothetical protein
MQPSQFDRLTVSLGSRLSRRRALATGIAGLSALTLSARGLPAIAQDATPEATTSDPVFLFVQLADSGAWTPHPTEEGSYLLTLRGTGEQTLYFSDRPDRIVGAMPTDRFLDALSFTPVNPPNAAIVVQTLEGVRDVLVVELFDPVYTRTFGDDGEEILTYNAKVMNAYQGNGLEEWVPQADDDQLPSDFSSVSLFIDDCADISGCYTKPGARYQYQGEVPGGPYGRCFDPVEWRCYPCAGVDGDRLDQLCNDTYPSCEGACTTDTCGNYGIC